MICFYILFKFLLKIHRINHFNIIFSLLFFKFLLRFLLQITALYQILNNIFLIASNKSHNHNIDKFIRKYFPFLFLAGNVIFSNDNANFAFLSFKKCEH